MCIRDRARNRTFEYLFDDDPLSREGQILILGGPEGGDIPWLLAEGVPPERILAINKQPSSHRSLKALYPEVDAHCTDIWKVLHRPICTAFIDLCGYLDARILDNLATLMQKCQTVAINVQKGREKHIADPMQERLGELYAAGIARSIYVTEGLLARGVRIEQTARIEYQSRDLRKPNGVPMLTLVLRCQKGGRMKSINFPSRLGWATQRVRQLIVGGVDRRRLNISAGVAAAWKAVAKRSYTWEERRTCRNLAKFFDREAQRLHHVKHALSRREAERLRCAKYRATPEGKEAKRLQDAKRRATPEGREEKRLQNAKYRAKKKALASLTSSATKDVGPAHLPGLK
jgi:hypothetical protein